jgi:hypothetical protein
MPAASALMPIPSYDDSTLTGRSIIEERFLAELHMIPKTLQIFFLFSGGGYFG